MEYVWKRGKWVAQDAGLPYDLVAYTSDGDSISLQRLFADEASEMLGVWIAPNGNTDTLVTNMRKIALAWGAKVRHGHTSQVETWQALHTTITAKLKYPLPAWSFHCKKRSSSWT